MLRHRWPLRRQGQVGYRMKEFIVSFRKVFRGWLVSLTVNLGFSRQAVLLSWLSTSPPALPSARHPAGQCLSRRPDPHTLPGPDGTDTHSSSFNVVSVPYYALHKFHTGGKKRVLTLYLFNSQASQMLDQPVNGLKCTVPYTLRWQV